jgi:hypothetical protein
MAKSDVTPRRWGRGLRIDDVRLAALVAQGLSIDQMAADLSVSKQAVAVRLRKLNLRSEYDAKSAARSAEIMATRYGVSVLALELCRGNGALAAYVRQRDTAKSRGIEWRFTLASWWQMWEDSGKWHLRGRNEGKGGWEMSRPGDVGPYSPENVVICTHKQNMQDVHAGMAARRRASRELYNLPLASAELM